MYKNLFVVMLSICVILTAQSNNSSKERRVYRTQTGAVIKAPSPIFKKGKKKSKGIYNEKTQAQVKLERAQIQLEQLGSQYNARLENLSSQIDLILEEQSKKRPTDTIFVYTTIYDTTTALDTTYIYTNATTTVYDTIIIIDSLHFNHYDTTTIAYTNYDTMVVLDTSYFYTYDTTVVRDTLWAFAFDTTIFYDTSWVFAYDTTVIRDSLWLYAFDSTVVYDTLVITNNDTVSIHTYSSNFPTNFSPNMVDQKMSAFPKYKTLGDALRARDSGDNSAQGWINQALNAAGGDWKRAEKEYLKLQEIYSTALVQAITKQSTGSNYIGPDMKYNSIIFDTLKVLTFDTTLVQDTIRNLVKQTYLKYDTTVVKKSKDVINFVTPPGHELILKYHSNGNVKERGLMKASKRNGDWIFYDVKGREIRRTSYADGEIKKDRDLNEGNDKQQSKKKKKKFWYPRSLKKN